MYADFYNLAEEPFPVTPDPKYLFLSDSHKEAIASIVYGIENRRGFVAVVGEVGTGKTTILRAYLDAIDKSKFTIIYVFNPEVTFEELVVLIAGELNIYSAEHNTATHVSLIHRALIEEYENDKTVVLIIDEAQNTPIATLESLRMLSNIETEQSKLLQIVLVGQPELQTLLERHELRQLNQRIAVKSTIMPLSNADSRRYIDDRLEFASLDSQPVFEESALARIVRFAGGIPRSINIACDMALINGFGHKARPVTERIAKEAIASLAAPGESGPPYWKPAVGALAATVLIGVAFWVGTHWQDNMGTAGNSPSVKTAQPAALKTVSEDASFARPEEYHSGTALMNTGVAQNTTNLSASINGANESTGSSSQPADAEAVQQTVAPPDADTPIGDGLRAVVGTDDPETTPAERITTIATGKPAYGSERWLRIRWDTRPLPASGFPMRYAVGLGDTLSQLCLEFYGFSTAEIHNFVRNSNPVLVNVDDLSVGDTLLFPALNAELQLLRSVSIKRKQRIKAMPMPLEAGP